MVGAYSVFANGGYERKPSYLVSIKDKNNRQIEKFSKPYYLNRKRAISAETAYAMAHIMEGVVDSGTARRLGGSSNSTTTLQEKQVPLKTKLMVGSLVTPQNSLQEHG